MHPEIIGSVGTRSPLSINALREDLGVAFNTAQGWLQALGRLYFLFELRPFAGRLARTLRGRRLSRVQQRAERVAEDVHAAEEEHFVLPDRPADDSAVLMAHEGFALGRFPSPCA